MRDARKVQWLGSSVELEQHVRSLGVGAVKRVELGVGAGGVAVETSGFLAPLIVLGILGLAIYGGVKAVGKLPGGR